MNQYVRDTRGIPTLILFEDGREKNRLVGLSTKEQIEALMKEERACSA